MYLNLLPAMENFKQKHIENDFVQGKKIMHISKLLNVTFISNVNLREEARVSSSFSFP